MVLACLQSHVHTSKSLKSGKEAKITSTVLYPQSWPHCYLSITHSRRDIEYEELTLTEFVAGYSQILLSPDLSEVERSSRLKHLVLLMYFSQLYDSQAVLSFHDVLLLQIEQGLLKWEDSFLHLESCTLYGHLKAKKLLLPFQFCFVVIIKEAHALSNKIIMVCSATFVPTAGWKDAPKSYTLRDRRSALVPLIQGQKKLISLSTFIHHVDFRNEDCFVSEVFDHDVLGTRLEEFHDNARLPVSPFVDD